MRRIRNKHILEITGYDKLNYVPKEIKEDWLIVRANSGVLDIELKHKD